MTIGELKQATADYASSVVQLCNEFAALKQENAQLKAQLKQLQQPEKNGVQPDAVEAE